MNPQMIKTALLILSIVSFAAPCSTSAQVEIEADPLAYALNGLSLHVAKVFGNVQANVGTFGLDVPTAYHGNSGWISTMRGVGVKLDHCDLHLLPPIRFAVNDSDRDRGSDSQFSRILP